MHHHLAPERRAAARSWQLPAMVAATVAATYLSYLLRSRCFGNHLAGQVLSAATGCDADLQVMWFQRGLAEHIVPYLHLLPTWGTPTTVEYPVLTGLLLWLLSLPAGSYQEFVAITAVAMGALAVVMTVLLHRRAGSRGWLWAVAPALVFYLTYNLDLPPVLCTIGAFTLVADQDPRTVARRHYLGAAVLLAVGGALKLFPLIFGPALLAWLLLGRPGAGQTPLAGRLRRTGEAAAAALAVLVAVNLPVFIANPSGWWAPLAYQASRAITRDTMSGWYFLSTWVDLPSSTLMSMATIATAAGLVAVLALGWWIGRRTGEFPLLATSLGLLVAYLLLNKVFSPQYALWVLPLLIFLGLRRWVVVLFAVIDVALYWTWHRLVLAAATGRLTAYAWWELASEVVTAARAWYLVAVAVVVLVVAARPSWRTRPVPEERTWLPEPVRDWVALGNVTQAR